MKSTDVPSARDHGMISPGHKIEFFEVSSYGALGTYARTIGKHDATTLLEETLNDKAQQTQDDSVVTDQSLPSAQSFENIANVSLKLPSAVKRRRTTRIS